MLNPSYRIYGAKIPYDFLKNVNIGDKVIVNDNGSCLEGNINSITYSGIGVEWLFSIRGVKFFKWFNVKEIIKNP